MASVLNFPMIEAAKAKMARYGGRVESGIGQVKTMAEVAAGAYGAARLSAHLGGPEGKKVFGLPVELAIAGAAGVVAATGMAGAHTTDLIALGVGAAAGYTARVGFIHGLKTANPDKVPDNKVAGEIGYRRPAELGAPMDEVEAILDHYGRQRQNARAA